MDIGAWLKNLGLGQYEVQFRDNAIDSEVLPSLTAEDLKEVGVTAVGHRRKLLDAIAALRTEPKTASETTLAPEPPPAGSPLSTSPPQKSADIAAERRPVTVMFCDLVGSTALSAKLDAEDWRDLVGGYLDAASEAVTQYGGHVLKKLGDGLMALFGYPSAQENDAERAARAALAILAALDALNVRNEVRGLPKLAARIGLDMGPVVVDATGEVFGDAPNVAARTQAAAEPGTALATFAVQRHIAGLFVAEDKGPHDLKGVSGRPILYRLVRASGGGRRGGARALTPFVGREEDLALLLRRWERARGGEGQFVQIVGEPGLGKSRLVEEFRARLGATPHTWVEWATSQLMQNTPLHPLGEWGRLRFGGADVAAEKRLADLEEALGHAKLDAGETAALLAPLLDIPVPEARAPKLAPEELRRRQLAAVAAWILASARAQPLVLAFEDLHWADPTTLDLMKTLVDRGAAAPAFIVATTRPEFRAPWATRSHHGVASLVPLDRAEIRKMVGTIAERHALSNEVMDGVTDRTGGVPLFVEEVTRLLLEGGAQGGAQAIPPTLQQSLAARLDRLGEAREVAQIGAVLGREFSYGLLASVAAVADRGGGLSEAALQAALEKLAEADLLFVEGHAPDTTYRFKHALIQDAAYESLLKSRRQALHRRAAEALLAAPDPQPELVAHHFTQAGDSEPAIEWWGKAGDAALRRSAFQEAIAHLGKAIELADKGEQKLQRDEPGPAEPRSKLHAGYALASMMTKGFGAEETKAALARAEVHAGAIRTPHDWTVLYGRISADMMRGDARAARAGAERFQKEAEALGLAGHALYARRTIAFLKLMAADFAGAVADLRTVIAQSGERLDPELLAIFGTDLVCFAQATLGHTIWYLGEFDESRRLFKAALDGATTWGQVSSQCAALFNDALVGARSGRAAAVLPVAETLLALAETNELEFWRAAGARLTGWARVRLGRRDAAEAFRARLQADAELGAKLNQPTSKALLADVERTLGRHDEALAAVAQGLAIADETGENWVRCWLLRLRGEVLVETDAAGAEAAYGDALRLSVAQGARSETLLVSVALAKLYQSTGRPLKAHAVLSDALEGFPRSSLLPSGRRAVDEGSAANDEGAGALALDLSPGRERGTAPSLEMPELAEARALLAALAETDAVKAEAARRDTRSKLHAGYALATMMTKGFGADATQDALARAASASSAGRTLEYWTIAYGRVSADLMRGDARAARAGAEAFVAEAEAAALPGQAACGRRMLGFIKFLDGELAAARADLSRALADFDERRDGALQTAFAVDHRAHAFAYLSQTVWFLGEFDEADRLRGEALALAKASGQPASLATALYCSCLFGALKGDPRAAVEAAREIGEVADRHDMKFWKAVASTYADWAAVSLGEPRAAEFRAGFGAFRDLGTRMQETALLPLLANVEHATGRSDAALAVADRGLSQGAEFGLNGWRPYLMIERAEILAGIDPARAEQGFRDAVERAAAQGSRALGLRAALALAKRLASAGRPTESHDALAPALEGFSPTPLFPAIAEAQALVAALAETDAVKADAARRETRSKLHAGYALATMMTKGFAADETKAALARAETAAGTARTPQYWTLLYGRISAAMAAADFRAARAGAEAFVAEAETLGLAGHAAFARRSLGFQRLVAGDFPGAAADLGRALAETDARRDAPLSNVFGLDVVATAMGARAQAIWYFGEFDEAARLIEAALAHAKEIGKPAAILHVNATRLILGFQSGRPDAVLKFAEEARALAVAHDLKYWQVTGPVWADWARARLGEPRPEVFAGYFAATSAMGVKLGMPILWGLYADVERAAGRKRGALEAVDRALAIGAENGEAEVRTWLLRLRADLLSDDEPKAAEAGYGEALRLASEQGSSVLALLAALSLAKFLSTRGRLGDAYAILAPALEGFAPTPHLPAIAEAQALIEDLL